ncbi:hypothetical protein HDU98_001992 [Podochytrium sp. JEL0797]|nr:hypothetical protein HDU98_001992 [Podochytrium sp. JEL0797]
MHMRSLTLTGTPLTSSLNVLIPLRNLETLVAKRCAIEILPAEFCTRMDHLKVLKLAQNHISDITHLQTLQSLTHLDLSHNAIQKFKPAIQTLHHIEYLETVDLRWNPITQAFYPGADSGRGGSGEFVALDKVFRRKLGDAVFVKRMFYRSVMSKSNSLRVVDGILIDSRERDKAEECFFCTPNHIMLLLKSFAKVIDNSGALVVEVINVMGGAKVASLGDEVVCVVKKARPVSTADGASSGAVSKLKKGDVSRGVVVRTVQPVRRLDGTFVKFDDNAVVMISKQGTPLGNRVLGVVALEARQKRWAKIASLAPKMV